MDSDENSCWGLRMLALRETPCEMIANSQRPDRVLAHRMNAPSRRYASSAFCGSGISSNAPVHTARGIVSAGELREGDQVHSYDNGLQTLIWVGFSRVGVVDGPVVRVNQAGGARSQMLLASNHRVLRRFADSEMLFGESEVLCPANALTGQDQFEHTRTAAPIMVHLLFDQFQLIHVGGLWVESHVPDMARTRLVAPEVADEILSAHPKLAFDSALASYVQSRLVLDEREVACLAG